MEPVTDTPPIQRRKRNYKIAERLISQQLGPLIKLLTKILHQCNTVQGSLLQNLTLSLKDRREPYLEVGQRVPIYIGHIEHELSFELPDGNIMKFTCLTDGTPTNVDPVKPSVELVSLTYELCGQALIQNAVPKVSHYQELVQTLSGSLTMTQEKIEQAQGRLSQLKTLFYSLQE